MMHRDPKLLKTARDQSCVACDAQDGTVVWAHSNLLEHGKGRGIKAHDAMGMFLCHRCHAELDQGSRMTKAERREFILTMICRTWLALCLQGRVGVV